MLFALNKMFGDDDDDDDICYWLRLTRVFMFGGSNFGYFILFETDFLRRARVNQRKNEKQKNKNENINDLIILNVKRKEKKKLNIKLNTKHYPDDLK